MSIIKYCSTLIIASLMLVLVGCSGSSGSSSSSSTLPNTTVLVYIVGSNLESDHSCPGGIGCATFNLNQMMQVGSTSNMNVVVETGGSTANGWGIVNRYQVEQGYLLQKQSVGSINMAESTAITSFIQWGVKNYPAQKYILVFWGHAGGPNGGYGGDDNFKVNNSSPYVSLPLIVDAVKKSNTQFQIIGFDSCLMGSTEVMSGLAPYAQYYIGSEDLEPGAGWNYTTFLQYVTNNPSASGAEIGKVIADGFVAQNAGEPTTLSVIDIAVFNQGLMATVNNFATALQPYVNSSIANWQSVARARLLSFDFDTSVFLGQKRKTTDLVDLKDFATHLQVLPPFESDAKLVTAAQTMIVAMDKSVSYESKSEATRERASGLTLYYPSIMLAFESKYVTTNTQNTPFYNSAYTNVVNSYWQYYMQESTRLVAYIQDDSVIESNNIISATVTGPFAQAYALGDGSNSCSLYTPITSGSNPITAPCYATLQVAYTSTKTESGYIISFNKNGPESTTWPTLTDGNNNSSNIVMIPDDTSISESPGSVGYYLIPVTKVNINTNTIVQEGYLRVLHNIDNTYEIVAYQYGAASNAQSVYPIESSDAFFLRKYTQYSADNNSWNFLTDRSTLYTQPYTIATNGSIRQNSIFAFVISDLTGQTYNPESIAYSQ